MCGLAGLIGRGATSNRLHAMLDSIRHRGPDTSRTWFAHGIAFGHNRLSIIDLSKAADQPMVDPATGNVIIFNGEIYNHAALRQELEGEFRFQTSHSDTEVILLGWKKWGPALLHKLDGMFAFAIYDPSNRCVFLARDPIGEKPVFYAQAPDGTLAFASEVKALLAWGCVRSEVDSDSIYHFLTVLAPEPGRTFFRGIQKLKAGHSLTMQIEGNKCLPEQACYFDAANFLNTTEDLDFAAIVDRSGRQLEQSIRSRAIADTRVAVALSAGLDSSLNLTHVAAFNAQQGISNQLSAICVSHDGSPPDESEAHVACRFAADLGVPFIQHDLSTERFLAQLDELSDFIVDSPVMSPHMVLLKSMANRLHSAGCRVLILGDGGDELGAYPSYYRALELFQGVRDNRPSKRANELLSNGRLVSSRHCHGFFEAEKVAAWTGPDPEQTTYELMLELMDRIEIPGEEGFMRKVLNLEYSLRLPEVLLPASDYASMSSGVEARSPMIGLSLVESTLRTSFFDRNLNGEAKAWIREYSKKYLPSYLLSQEKRGFGREFGRDMANSLCRFWVNSLASGTTEPVFEYVTKDFISSLVDRHLSGRNQGTRLFIPYTLNRWLTRVQRT